MNAPNDQEMTRKNARAGLMVLAVVGGMIALTFASVPLYSLFCRVTGFGGTTQVAGALPEEIIDRTVTVQFNADVNRELNWDFSPELRNIPVKLGQQGVIAFHAKSRAREPVAGTALYNVTPLKAGKYFNKIQCFCFDAQVLTPGQEVSMPVLFYIDPAMNDDPNMDDVKTITLSYTFFKSETKALEEALEAFYNEDENTPKGTQ